GQRARARPDRLHEEVERARGGVHGEDRERPAQRRLRGGAGLDHHELPGPSRTRDLLVAEREEDVGALERPPQHQLGLAICGRGSVHPPAMIARAVYTRAMRLRTVAAAGLAALVLA